MLTKLRMFYEKFKSYTKHSVRSYEVLVVEVEDDEVELDDELVTHKMRILKRSSTKE